MNFELAFYQIDHRLIALGMIVLLAVAGEMGFRWGSAQRDAPDTYRSLMSGIGAATFGLLGLLLGFTLSMAIARLDTRHKVLVDESNAIGTLSLRAGLFEQPIRDELRASLRDYAGARIALGNSIGDTEAWDAARKKSETLHTAIWSAVQRAGARETSNAKLSSLITAANELIDIHELRIASVENYLPASLLLLLLGVSAVSIYLLAWAFGAADYTAVGAGSFGGRVALGLLGLLIVAVLFVIMDINRPQRGIFQTGVATLERAEQSISESSTP